jgi:mannose/cellobiose epimerase-like protein (N-acyl-D-glucosamine 2-epimerase family)
VLRCSQRLWAAVITLPRTGKTPVPGNRRGPSGAPNVPIPMSHSTAAPHLPDFRSRQFLLGHVGHTMAFYHPRCIDPAGGFFQFFKDDGQVYDAATRHLVSSTRFVFNYAMAWQAFAEPAYQQALAHGIAYLRDVHRNPATGGYAWLLADGRVMDDTNHCYGLAFVVLAYAKALDAGIGQAREWIEQTWELMEARFWDARHGLYADEADAHWVLSPYRGQNANMHACEAWLAAYEATGQQRYLERAAELARNIVFRQASLSGGLVWEHYRPDWSPDWDYNRGDRSNIFRPWGFQAGHQVEWAKLLLVLDRHLPDPMWLPRARALFDRAMDMAWDGRHGGLVYGNDPQGGVYDADKYFWVQAEAIATAALLAARTGEPGYWAWYQRLWTYSWRHFVDHQYGAWYRILSPDNRKLGDEKSPAGKTDYHTMGACYEVLKVV